MKDSAWLFVPPQCKEGECKLIILPGGCNAWTDGVRRWGRGRAG